MSCQLDTFSNNSVYGKTANVFSLSNLGTVKVIFSLILMTCLDKVPWASWSEYAFNTPSLSYETTRPNEQDCTTEVKWHSGRGTIMIPA